MHRTSGQCVLCLKLIQVRTKPEHVLLNALGGRATVRDILCTQCNEAMGRGPDQDLADSVAMLRSIGNLSSGDRGGPPHIQNLASEGMIFDLGPGMRVKPRMKGNKINVSTQGEEIRISVKAGTEDELDGLIHNAARAVAKELGHTDRRIVEAIRTDLLRNHTRNESIVPAPSIKGQIEFGSGRSQQAMAKAALVLWARLVGTEEVAQSRYDQIRSFTWNGNKPSDPTSLVKLDYRALPEVPEKFGTNPNVIQVISDRSGAVYGYFRLYGAVGWRFLLCAAGAPADRAHSLISNPFQNEIFELAADGDAVLSPGWILADWDLDEPEMDHVVRRISALTAHGGKTSRMMMLENWFHEAIRQCGCKEGDSLTEEHISFISKYIADRMMVYLTRKPLRLSTTTAE